MCGCLIGLVRNAIGRRPVADDPAELQAAKARTAVAPAADAKARLVLLGTAGGPSFWPGTKRVGTGSAIIVGDAAYMIDCGAGAARRAAEALHPRLTGPKTRNTQALRQLKALFLTHMHSDHVADLAPLLLYGYYCGLDAPGRGPLQIYGPGPRGELPPVFKIPGSDTADPPVFAPDNPTPGTRDMIGLLLRAYATDINDRTHDGGRRPAGGLVEAHDIVLPPIDGFMSPNRTPHPAMEPFKVYEDDRVKVTATLVMHEPIFPAFGYRFDTDEGSVVFSGDTGPSANLIRLAKGADVLVHEIIVASYIDGAYPANGTPAQQANRAHLLRAHTQVDEVGRIAEEAGVHTLVLNHMVPGNATAAELQGAQEGFSGRMVIGDDLLEVSLRRR
jgi:ribonuclease BN (tRNA processing enzyme)